VKTGEVELVGAGSSRSAYKPQRIGAKVDMLHSHFGASHSEGTTLCIKGWQNRVLGYSEILLNTMA
jgi:hypothetical protein